MFEKLKKSIKDYEVRRAIKQKERLRKKGQKITEILCELYEGAIKESESILSEKMRECEEIQSYSKFFNECLADRVCMEGSSEICNVYHGILKGYELKLESINEKIDECYKCKDILNRVLFYTNNPTISDMYDIPFNVPFKVEIKEIKLGRKKIYIP